MDELERNNYAELCGTLAAPPALSHENRQERFFTFPLETQRLSGTIDRVNIVVRERLLAEMPLEEPARLCVTGDVRSFNNRAGRAQSWLSRCSRATSRPVTSRMTAT